MYYGGINKLANVIGEFLKQDFDWFHLNCGSERSGKTTLSLRLAYAVEPTLTMDNFIFSFEDFKKVLDGNKKLKVVVIDEGAISLFSREAMKYETRELIKVITILGHRNLLVIINIPDITIIDSYIRNFRLRSLSKTILYKSKKNIVPKRGIAYIYGARTAKGIKKNMYGKIYWPPPQGLIKFKKITPRDGKLFDLWQEYQVKSKAFKTAYEKGNTPEKTNYDKALAGVSKNWKKFISNFADRKYINIHKIMSKYNGIGEDKAKKIKILVEEQHNI